MAFGSRFLAFGSSWLLALVLVVGRFLCFCHGLCGEEDLREGGRILSTDRDTVGSNCSIENGLSNFDRRNNSKSSNREIRAR